MDLTAEDLTRFRSKVDTAPGHGPWGDCHIWTAGRFEKRGGYGAFWWNGKMWLAHRIAYLISHGEVLDWVLHRCDNPPCVRDDHLFAGDAVSNHADMVAKGRHLQPLPITIDPLLGCHRWTGRKDNRGYPKVQRSGRGRSAQQVVWEQERGPVPRGHRIRMDCEVRDCVWIHHMRLVRYGG